MDDRTIKNDPSNRYGMSHLELLKALRPIWQGWPGSNRRHPVLETGALPTELHP